MSEPEELRERNVIEATWKSQEEEQQFNMRIALTADELCALARSREKLNTLVNLAVAAVTAIFAGAFLYNIYAIEQPWIRLGQAWTLGAIVYLFWPAFSSRGRRLGASEPCARFLERQHEERRLGYLRIRRGLFLFIPGIAASWLGGGPLATVKGRGLDPSSWFYRFWTGPWLFVMIGVALILVWLAFGKAAENAARDREEVRCVIEQ
jgi:hypothetical protein